MLDDLLEVLGDSAEVLDDSAEVLGDSAEVLGDSAEVLDDSAEAILQNCQILFLGLSARVSKAGLLKAISGSGSSRATSGVLEGLMPLTAVFVTWIIAGGATI